MADLGNLSIVAPALGSAFAASLVEIVEAFAIVLAVATLRGWRSAAAGTAALVALLDRLLDHIPLAPLQFTIGTPLLFFGLGWYRDGHLQGEV